MATAFFPAIIERAEEGFNVFFPDLPGCTSAGATTTEAALNASQSLAGHLVELARVGEVIPTPVELVPAERCADVDEVARILVRAELPGRSLRINITLDECLIAAIDKIASNRSGFLAEAARNELARRNDYA